MAGAPHAQELDQSYKTDAPSTASDALRSAFTEQFQPNSNQDVTSFAKVINDMTKSDAATKLVNDLFGDPSKIFDEKSLKELADAKATEAFVAAIMPTPKSEAEKTADIQTSDSAAADAGNTVVVSDGDLGRLLSARGSLGGSMAEQLAAARIDAAITQVQGKLAAQARNNDLGGPLTGGEAQQSMNADALRYRLQQDYQKSA